MGGAGGSAVGGEEVVHPEGSKNSLVKVGRQGEQKESSPRDATSS